ncbi:hypothetical protein DVS28_b0189 (plasmid) [Euzebya pacifica]|uniref:Uncharacterized protein n=1 Tax=Euzebya pacifica TaxID=1608957 RepID=A0A346Y662_9ACTN|nr:hypothetical protein [Euzebya pacifica]AXV09959.1 hypothetical protein DVS28_b0189 [Euzebya pacifica]
MGKRWNDVTVNAPGVAELGDTGIVLDIDRPTTGRMGFVFADVHTPDGTTRRLIEPRYALTHDTVRYQITRIDGDDVTIAWRTVPHRFAPRIQGFLRRIRPRPSVPAPGAATVPPSV